MVLNLPYPPTINHYWLASGHRRFISPAGQRFRRDACYIASSAKTRQKPANSTLAVSVRVELYPPDRRKRDIDNVLKPILDALQHAGVIDNDYQVWELVVRRCEVRKGGSVRVTVSPLV